VPRGQERHRGRLAAFGHDGLAVESNRDGMAQRFGGPKAGEARHGVARKCIVAVGRVTYQIFRTKSVDALLAQAAENERGGASLKKVLGPASLIALGVGAIIGTGIFATIGTASAGDANRPGAGPALMLSFVLTAVVCSFTALCYAEFASMVPTAGSAYTYAYATLGELAAWIIGWDLLLEYAIGNTAVAISWAGYADALLRGVGVVLPRWLVTDYRTAASASDVLANAPHVFGVPIVFNALAMGIVAVVTMVLVWGVKESARFNAVMVGVKLVVLAFFVLVCARFVRPGNWHPFAPNGFAGIGAGAAVIFFAYIGFDAVSTCAEECKNPGRDMPIGIIGSLVLCTVIYVVVAAVFSGLVPYPALVHLDPSRRAEALAVAMEYAAAPGWAIGIVALGSVVAQTAVLLVFQLGQPRILFAMARDGLLPPVFARVHPKFGTPHVSTILTGALVGIVSAFASIDEMVDLTNIGTLFAFILVCVGISILRFREPGRTRPFRVPFGPLLVPVLGVMSCLVLVAYLPPSSWMRFVGWLVAGLVVYGSYGFWRSRARGAGVGVR
jgi:APA family basic amino acid/polyamine antiporter